MTNVSNQPTIEGQETQKHDKDTIEQKTPIIQQIFPKRHKPVHIVRKAVHQKKESIIQIEAQPSPCSVLPLENIENQV
jgi:hypothetical protein